MKVKYLFMATLAIGLTACGGANKKNKVQITDAKEVATEVKQNLTVNTSTSVVDWTGYKIGGNHTGTFKLQSGTISIDGEQLLSGSFVIDMNEIGVTDLEAGKLRDQLVGHLKSEDFFDVAKYPTASFDITSAKKLDSNNYMIEGNLTMKEVTKNISFQIQVTKNGAGVYTATTNTFVINRTDWGVNYGSKNIFKDLKDAAIQDDVEIKFTINAQE